MATQTVTQPITQTSPVLAPLTQPIAKPTGIPLPPLSSGSNGGLGIAALAWLQAQPVGSVHSTRAIVQALGRMPGQVQGQPVFNALRKLHMAGTIVGTPSGTQRGYVWQLPVPVVTPTAPTATTQPAAKPRKGKQAK